MQGRELAWKFAQDNWDELYNRYEGGFLLSRLIKVQYIDASWPIFELGIENSATFSEL